MCVVSFTPQTFRPGRNSILYQLDRKLCGSQSRSACCEEEKNPLPLPGINPWLLTSPARSLDSTPTEDNIKSICLSMLRLYSIDLLRVTLWRCQKSNRRMVSGIWIGKDMWGCGRGLILRHYTVICFERLRKTMEIAEKSQSLGSDLNLRPPDSYSLDHDISETIQMQVLCSSQRSSLSEHNGWAYSVSRSDSCVPCKVDWENWNHVETTTTESSSSSTWECSSVWRLSEMHAQ